MGKEAVLRSGEGKGIRMRVWLRIGIHILLFFPALPRWAAACENSSVRDAAFLEARDVHRLCLVSKTTDAQAAARPAIEAWLREQAPGLNVELSLATIDDPATDWSRYGIPSAPPECPVAILAGYHTAERAAFFVDHWAPGPTREELEQIARSPARDELRRRAARDLAVLLHFPATSDAAPTAATDALAAVTRRWSGRGTGAVSILAVDRTDPRERLLTSFTGVPYQGDDWVAVVFGRCKLMPPLTGPEITEPALDEQIRSLLEPCTCLRSPGAIGVDMPMVWREADDATIALLHGGGATDLADGVLARSGDAAAELAPAGARTRLLLPILATLGALALTQGIVALLLLLRRRAAARVRS